MSKRTFKLKEAAGNRLKVLLQNQALASERVYQFYSGFLSDKLSEDELNQISDVSVENGSIVVELPEESKDAVVREN